MNWKKSVVFLFLLVFLTNVYYSNVVKAETISTNLEIRVGLTAMYSKKDSITIYNESLGYGYCMGNSYTQELILHSTDGFIFNPVTGCVVSETKIYPSYQSAKQVAEKYIEHGIMAYVGSTYQYKWRVYFGTTSNELEAEQLIDTIKKKENGSSLEVINENNYRVLLEGSFGTILIDVDENYAYPQLRPLTIYKNGVKCIDMGARVYRGRMEIGRYGKTTLTAVNILPMEEYLYSVVPSEMISTWHEEALKAQAVCARSYALMQTGYGGRSDAKKGYKIVDTASSQVYKGFLEESARAKKAVNDTRGEFVCYDNKVVTTYFFCTSGGSTEDVKRVWGTERPYLQSVSDFYEGDVFRASWQITVTKEDIISALSKKEKKVGDVFQLSVVEYSPTGRVAKLSVDGSDNSIILTGATIKSLLNLYSTTQRATTPYTRLSSAV